MRFAPRPIRFGQRPASSEDEADGLPTPARVRLAARRAAGIAEAKSILADLPEAGESVHCICSARMDLADIVHHLLERLGRCDQMTIATLGYNARNLKTMLAWMDAGAVGSLALVASIFFRSHNQQLWERTQKEFRERGQRAACCHSHAKVVTMAFASGERLSIEGSANLCGNGSAREQFALIHHAELHDWHAAWIGGLIDKHEGKSDA